MNDRELLIVRKKAQVAILNAVSVQMCRGEGKDYIIKISKQIEDELRIIEDQADNSSHSGEHN